MIEKIEPWWTPDQYTKALQRAEEMGAGTRDCGGWTWDPPCGSCTGCFIMMVAHSQQTGYQEPKFRARERGLKYWPVLRLNPWSSDIRPMYHSSYHHLLHPRT